jgi:hypothetical protein
MRFSTIAITCIPALLSALPVMASFHPLSGSLRLPSKIVTSSDGLQIFTESAGKEGAPAGKSPSLSPDSKELSDATLYSNLPARTRLHLGCV